MKVAARQINKAKKADISDTVVFMAAYNIDKITKQFPRIWKKKKAKELIKSHHIAAIVSDNIVFTPNGRFSYTEEYDYVNQNTRISFGKNCDNIKTEKQQEELSRVSWLLTFRHSAHLLLDESLFRISFLIDMEPFLVSIYSNIIQVDPVVFFMNGVLFINYELIDFNSGKPFDRGKCKGVKSNYNILSVEKLKYFDELDFSDDNRKISDIIFSNVTDCFSDMTRKKYRTESFSFLHNTFIITKKGLNIEEFFQAAIGADIPNLKLQNISGTKEFRYYSHDSFGLVEISSKVFSQQVLFDGLLLESVKMYLCLQSVIGVDQMNNLEKLLQQRAYIESLRYPSHVPIITDNALKVFTNTNSFIHHTSALDLKIQYFSMLQERQKAKNSRLLSILLYILAVISSIGALGTLHTEIGLSFKLGLTIIIPFFGALGAYWYYNEKKE